MSWTLKSAYMALVGLSAAVLWPPELSAQREVPAQPSTRERQQRRPRPQAQPLQIENVDPRVERILQEWSRATRTIQRLEGGHERFSYDLVFGVEKRATGRFFYEAPDKGRIDIEPKRIPNGETSDRQDAKGRPFRLKADAPEKWICDGTQIFQIDEVNRKAERFEIPPQARGRNIMQGPLPFLLGMPPQMAKERYRIELDERAFLRDGIDVEGARSPAGSVWLRIYPKWRHDAASYKEAAVILDPNNHYLPYAVQLKDPSGNQETVYWFKDLKVNKRHLLQWITGDPLKIDLSRYEVHEVGGGQSRKPGDRSGGAAGSRAADPRRTAQATETRVVPKVVGLPYGEAQKAMEQAGFKVVYLRGSQVTDRRFRHRVESQSPQPQQKLPAGSEVKLKLYITAEDIAEQQQKSSSRRPTTRSALRQP